MENARIERARMDADVVCVGFGPAMGGFLTTISRGIPADDGRFPTVICYERADDIAFGVSGVVTRARGIRAAFPEIEAQGIPMATPVSGEEVYYLLDPVGASRRSAVLRAADAALLVSGEAKQHAFRLPYIPPFLQKHGGLVMSIGQFSQWVGQQVMISGTAQIWPGTPVAAALIEGDAVRGVQLADQGVTLTGAPADAFQPGMEIRAPLTVVADGPMGPVGRQLDERFGMPPGHENREWAVGMKMVIDLPAGCPLAPGMVIHTFGYPEPEIFGFLYVHPENMASVGIFIPSWLENPLRTSYRYLQHYILHPLLWRYLEGGRLRSWGAKSLNESGKRGEPHLAGTGWARIGEGSGSTNILAGSGVDEAWTTGVQLGEAVLELWRERAPFTKENLERTYVARRRASWLEDEASAAQHARDGFHRGVVTGMLGMALAGLTGGRLRMPGTESHGFPSIEEFFAGRISAGELEAIRRHAAARGEALHDAVMNRCGWPEIPYDGQLLISQQDALLLGGKVRAPAGYADHIRFGDAAVCADCAAKTCIEICSAQALMPGDGTPAFDREKCIHCGACVWNCDFNNIDFRAGAGGLHSAEN